MVAAPIRLRQCVIRVGTGSAALRDLLPFAGRPCILSPELRDSGAATLTVFGLHAPHELQARDNDAMRARLTDAVLASLNSVLAEPIQDVLMTDSRGRPCIEAKTTVDLEQTLNMTGGNIFTAHWPGPSPRMLIRWTLSRTEVGCGDRP